MLVTEKKEFAKGAFLAVTFFVVLFLMFSPLFGGRNAFKAADDLFNSIAKGSSYFIDKIREEAREFEGSSVQVKITLKSEELAEKSGAILAAAGAEVRREGAELVVAGDLGRLVNAALDDSEAMFHNRGKEVSQKYGQPEKEVLFGWWSAFKDTVMDLKHQEKFKEAAFLEKVMKKTLEVGYNFYGIEPKKASANAGILGFALVFYVVYTLWWGYAILYLFHGLGLEMKAGSRKEV